MPYFCCEVFYCTQDHIKNRTWNKHTHRWVVHLSWQKYPLDEAFHRWNCTSLTSKWYRQTVAGCRSVRLSVCLASTANQWAHRKHRSCTVYKPTFEIHVQQLSYVLSYGTLYTYSDVIIHYIHPVYTSIDIRIYLSPIIYLLPVYFRPNLLE